MGINLEAERFFEKALAPCAPTRFLVGSDTWVVERWKSYPQLMAEYREWLGQLPREVAERVAWRNAAEMFGVTLSPALSHATFHSLGARGRGGL